ncbi:hypothetical protein Sgou_44780 [Streptomyces gougerotii]|uniref:Glycosyltransferase 2-like domain-containing protein n=1 Tax=Streptomyces gougerotii TaxID=53448 RepID=A0ABQ1DBF1_9ACTN|nr:hypothetical protein Sgou_44780 [Streptomyces gougerotii]
MTGAPGLPEPVAEGSPRGFSVIVCVHTEERWQDILDAVASLGAQSLPPLEILLVVDHHPVLLERLEHRFADGPPQVRVMPNAGPRGLSAGRNTGVGAARGEWVAFLDDDAVADPDWLRHLAAGYADPGVLAVGGRTEPRWESGRRPGWFPEEFDWVVGCTYRGHPSGGARVRNVLGGNASFPPLRLRPRRGFRTRHRPGRRAAAARRGGDGVLRPAHPGPAGRGPARRRPGPSSTTGCRGHGSGSPTSAPAPGPRASPRHWCARSVGAGAGLSSERRHTTRVLPAAVARGLADALRGRPGRGRAGRSGPRGDGRGGRRLPGRLLAGPPRRRAALHPSPGSPGTGAAARPTGAAPEAGS